MKSRMIANRRSPVKKATTLVSKQTLEQAIQEGNLVVEQLMQQNAHDPSLDQLEETVTFLSSILTKSPTEMQAEGASNIEDYLDDAVMPEMAAKIKQGVDMIAEKKNALRTQAPTPAEAPVMASGSDNWVSDRDEKGEPKAPEKVEVPRLAADKKAAPAAAPAPAAAAPAPAPAPVSKPEADITQLSSDTLAKMQKALAGAEDLMNDKAAQAFIAAIAEELMNRPVEAEPPAAPAAPKAAKLGGLKIADAEETAVRHDDVPVAPTPNVFQGGDDTKAEDTKTATAKEAVAPEGWEGTVKEMKKHKDIDNPWALSWYMKDKGYKSHEGSLETWKMAQASLKLELLSKYASAQGGSFFVSNQETGNVLEGGERVKEIAQAHSMQEYHTGIEMPKTDLPSKFAADMTANKALKLSEKMADQLKGMYLEAKQLTEINDSRPVREAAEAIYRAYDMFGEASKVLNKQVMQEEQEAKAVEVKKENKKSSFLGLSVAAAEEKKCKCGKPVYGKYGEYSRCKDCYEEQGAEAEKATGVQ